MQAFADALLVIPKTLAQNSGYDAQTALLDVLVSPFVTVVARSPGPHVLLLLEQDEIKSAEDAKAPGLLGLDIDSGKAMYPDKKGIWDNVRVKKQFLTLG